ncbi:endonuclease V [Halovivax gelatinilyticus]|uniref:endonuclease V n=1 Tax=Halovivax gelatinilyticus TaxID=2961597 RepID=UPI0020CA5EA6|nr:endonuclease V [Halovivax gelatinilyticus]
MTPDPRPDLAPDSSLSREEMEALQREIARSAVFADDFGFDPTTLDAPRDPVDPTSVESAQTTFADDETPLVAGVDQSFLIEQDRAVSAIVVVQPTGSSWSVVERVHAVTPLEIPYIPGLLSFREGGPILAAVEQLTVEPDVYLFDGSGRIHFRQAGIATHIGVVLDRPSVGVAKSLLCGEPVAPTEGLAAGERVAIEANERVDAPDGTTIGYAVQTKQYDSSNRHVNPLYVSPGHRVCAETAADLVLGLSAGYKLPKPTRLADAHADEVKGEYV